MIDFSNGSVFKLTRTGSRRGEEMIAPLLVPGERVIAEYTSVRDMVIFTSRRIVAVNVQGITGTKKDFTTLPYARVQAFSVETAGVMDLDSELELYFSGLGRVRFEFRGDNNVTEIGRLIGEMIL